MGIRNKAFEFIDMVDDSNRGKLSPEEEDKLRDWADRIEKNIMNFGRRKRKNYFDS